MVGGGDFVGFFHGGGGATQRLAGFFDLGIVFLKSQFIHQLKQVFRDVGKFLRAFVSIKEGFGKKAAVEKDLSSGDGFDVRAFPVASACAHLADLAVFAGEDTPLHFAVGCDKHIQRGACLSGENVHSFSNSFQVQKRGAKLFESRICIYGFQFDSPESSDDAKVSNILFV